MKLVAALKAYPLQIDTKIQGTYTAILVIPKLISSIHLNKLYYLFVANKPIFGFLVRSIISPFNWLLNLSSLILLLFNMLITNQMPQYINQ